MRKIGMFMVAILVASMSMMAQENTNAKEGNRKSRTETVEQRAERMTPRMVKELSLTEAQAAPLLIINKDLATARQDLKTTQDNAPTKPM